MLMVDSLQDERRVLVTSEEYTRQMKLSYSISMWSGTARLDVEDPGSVGLEESELAEVDKSLIPSALRNIFLPLLWISSSYLANYSGTWSSSSSLALLVSTLGRDPAPSATL